MNKREIGTFYEEAVCEYLKQNGIWIVERNFRCHQGEVDIIGKEGDCLVFFEVKYRKTNAFGDALQAVPYNKQKKICRCADFYCVKHRWKGQIRFDVIGITGTKIDWIRNAFDHIGYHWE